MPPAVLLSILAAGFAAGALNAVAGGGSFISLPALIGCGVPAVAANAASTVALLPPGQLAAWRFRKQLRRFEGVGFAPLLAISFVGGALGAWLLKATPVAAFDLILPWLVLVATATFAVGRRAGAVLRRHVSVGPRSLLVIQFGLAIYGGYFGGGVGIMMMAAWSLFTTHDPLELNATRMLMATTANLAASIYFLASGLAPWREVLVMMAGAFVGSWLGAGLVSRLGPTRLSAVVVATGAAMTLVLFARAFGLLKLGAG